MLIWSLFLFIAITFAFLSKSSSTITLRYFSKLFLIILLCWYSGFRDHLGTDYPTYCDFLTGTSYLEFGIEPLFRLFAFIVYNTPLSPIFFFLITAIITNYLFVSSIYRYEFAFLSIILYLLNPLCYFDTFNAVRQMFAASLFFYAIQYIETKCFWKFFIWILIASTMHISALMLVPVYFIINKKYSRISMSLTVVLSFVLGSIIKIDINNLIEKFIPIYAIYANTDTQHEGSGLLNIIFNIILIILLVFEKRINNNNRNNIIINGFAFGIILTNFMPSFYYISRFALYFSIFSAIAVPQLCKIIKGKFLQFAILAVFILLFFYFLFTHVSDKTVIPSKILFLNELFD